jgi:cell division protein FtsL
VAVACLALCGAVIFGLVLVNIYLAQSSFRLADLQSRIAQEEASYRRFRLEVATRESPEKVAKMASDLGLTPPATQDYIPGPPVVIAREKNGPHVAAAAAGTSGR